MELKIVRLTDEAMEKRDYRDFISLELEGEYLDFYDGEPEDNTLARNFSSAFDIKEMILLANKLGLEGKKINVVKEFVDEI